MSKSKPLIPFSWIPASWGVKGNTRKIMQAEYELDGVELELKLNEINNENDAILQQAAELDIKFKYNTISEREYDYGIAELRDDPETMLKVKLKHNDITEKEYNKELATTRGEPYVDIPEITFDVENPGGGSLELDWNDIFITMLEEAGYVAQTDEDKVDLWLTDLCRNIALQELMDTGNFNEDSEEAMSIKRKRMDDGSIEVS